MKKKKLKTSTQQTQVHQSTDAFYQDLAEKCREAIVYIEAIHAPIFTGPWRIQKLLTGSSSSTWRALHKLFSRMQSETPQDDPKIGVSGTGFFIANDSIVTNVHVVADAHTVAAKQIIDDEIVLYQIIGVTAFDPTNDLVVLKVDKKCPSPLPIGSSDNLQDGDDVCILTYAKAIYSHIIGTISNKGRTSKYHTIETALAPGNSGSPVLNSGGEVIGIADSCLRSLANITHTEFANAIHSNILVTLLKNPIATETFNTWQKRPSIHAYRINQQGDKRLHKRKFAKAVKKYDNAIAKNPNLVRTYMNRSTAKMRLLDYDGAISDSDIVTKLYPNMMQPYLNRAVVKLSIYELDDGLKEISTAFNNFPQDGQIFKLYFIRAATHAALADMEKAMDDIDKAISIKPDYAEAYAVRAKIKFEMQDYQEALNNADKGIELKPNIGLCLTTQSDVRCEYGRFLDDHKDSPTVLDLYQEALEVAQKAIQIDPDSANAFCARAKAYQQIGETHAKNGEIEKATELFNAAIADWTKSIQIKPILPPPYNGRGWTKYLLGKLETDQGHQRMAKKHYKTAIVDCNEAIRLLKGTYFAYTAYHTRAATQAALGNYNQAIQDWTTAIKLNPTHIRSYQDRANVYKIIGKKDNAQNDLNVVKKINDSLAVKSFKVGQSKYQQKDYESAVVCFDIVINLKSRYHQAYNNRGMAKSAIGRAEFRKRNITEAQRHLKEGIADYTEAIKIDPKCASAYSNRGNAKYSLGKFESDSGRTEQAQKYFKQAIEDVEIAIELDPKYTKAYRVRDNVKKALGQH